MTVSRTIEIAYEAPDEATALAYEKMLGNLVMTGRDDGCGCCVDYYPISNQAMSAGPAMPPTTPLVGSAPRPLAHADPPHPWHLLWCPGCSYSVSWTVADACEFSGTADAWLDLLDAACRHECPARVGDDG